MNPVLLPTSPVGSYPQPEWLIDRKKLAGRFPPRTRARELWRVSPEFLGEAQDDATILAIRDQERAGLDIITDGEISAKATRTGLPPHWTVWTWRIPARRLTAAVIPTLCRASLGGFVASIPYKYETFNSSEPIPAG